MKELKGKKEKVEKNEKIEQGRNRVKEGKIFD